MGSAGSEALKRTHGYYMIPQKLFKVKEVMLIQNCLLNESKVGVSKTVDIVIKQYIKV